MDEKGADDDEKKEKDYDEYDQGGDDESGRLFVRRDLLKANM